MPSYTVDYRINYPKSIDIHFFGGEEVYKEHNLLGIQDYVAHILDTNIISSETVNVS